MTKHYNTSISESAARTFNTKSFDSLPDEVSGIMATVEILQPFRIVRSAVNLNNSSATIYTTPSDKDFYLVYAALCNVGDVTASGVQVKLNVTIDGVSQGIIDIPRLGVTAGQQLRSFVNLPLPGVKVDRNTTITITHNDSTATTRSHGVIVGYTVETTKT